MSLRPVSKIRKPNGGPVVLALDFDGVLHSYDYWRGVIPTGEPVPGALEFVKWALGAGYEIALVSSRANEDGGVNGIYEWLRKHDFPVNVVITARKIPADLYVDDRGLRFEGHFEMVRQFLNNFPIPGRWQKPGERG